METEILVGWIAIASSILLTCVGLPAQIWKNFTRASTAGLSVGMMFISHLAFVIWTIYGFVKTPEDWFIVAGNLPGAICTGIVLFQMYHYRKNQ